MIDDEHDLLDLIEYNLSKQGFSVFTADNGEDGLELAKSNLPHLILLDIMMPGMDGQEVYRRLKADPQLESIPVVYLTARDDESTEITSLDRGADDYLVKPISNKKLNSRVNAVLRRSEQDAEPQPVLESGDLVVDRQRYIVSRKGKEYTLPRKEFEILFFLMKNKGNVFSREDLLNKIWGDDIFVIDRTVDVHIRKIREKIGSKYIQTVKGIGYRFKA